MIFYDGVRKDFHVGLLRLEEGRRSGKVSLEVKFSGKEARFVEEINW